MMDGGLADGEVGDCSIRGGDVCGSFLSVSSWRKPKKKKQLVFVWNAKKKKNTTFACKPSIVRMDSPLNVVTRFRF